LTIKKCTFDGNKADKSGGAIYADQYGTLKLYDTTFKNNYAKLYGGAIFAPIKTLSKVVDSNCVYKNNKAGKGAAHVYGVFSVKVSKVSSNYGSVVLKAKVSTPWKLLKTQKVGFKLVKGSKKYYSSVKKTNSKGEVIQKVPGKIKLGKYQAYAFSHEGTNYAKAVSLTVTKAPCKVVLKKTTIKYKTSIVKAKLMNTKSKYIVSGAKLKVKVIGKWGSFSYIATASGDGIVKISTGKLSKGSYGLKITSADKNIKLKKFSVKIKIK
jgi:predicted outer membrane repeat protein